MIESRSRLTGRRHVIIYGSDVSYEHPETGRTEQLEPETFGRKRHEMGGSVTVTYNPRTGEGARVGERRWAGMAVLSALAMVLIVPQLVEWVR